MAIALNVFQAGKKAIAQEVNDNFSMLQEEITTSIDGIKSDVQSSFTEAKEQILSDIEVVKNSKLNVDLGNIGESLNTTGLNKILNYILPDTQKSSAYSIDSGFVAPCDGWVYVNVRGYSGGKYNIYINDYEFVNDKSDGGLCSASLSMLIRKGDKVTFSKSNAYVASFRPTVTKIKE